MKFNRELSIIQQKMAATSAGVNRRQAVLQALNLEAGQTILDVGCGGGLSESESETQRQSLRLMACFSANSRICQEGIWTRGKHESEI